MSTKGWTKTDMPSQNGKIAIVTGGTGGLGYETGLGLAEAGATVILVGRSPTKGKEALDKIFSCAPSSKIFFEFTDLGSLNSVSDFCTRFNSKYDTLDILVNNGGLMGPHTRGITEDGFELQFGTNYLSHFAMTSQLLPALRKSANPRVVNISSILARQGKIYFEDIQFEKYYHPRESYRQSKLAQLIFNLELQRQSDAKEWGLTCVASHPGYAITDLLSNGPGDDSWYARYHRWVLAPFFSHSGADGALTSLYAATCPQATPGGYYAPNGILELRGPTAPAYIPTQAKDVETTKTLWDLSVTLTGTTWP